MSKRKLSKIIAASLLLAMPLTFASCDMADSGGYMGADMEMTLGESGNEYTEIIENAFINTADADTSYFSIDANTASYPNLRNMINNGYDIPKDAVRVEEMLNYFSYDYKAPIGGDIMALTSSVFDTPYNSETKLMTVGLATERVEMSDVKNNLVFLIDTSGSMSASNKLGLVQNAFTLMTDNLNPDDRVSIVTYAGDDTVALSGAYGYEKEKIKAVVEDLMSGGSTAGSEGIETAYELASQYFIEGGNNRVILATDGDFNVGITNNAALEKFISMKRERGIYLSVYGVGYGNLKSDTMETLALKGNGTYGYLDSALEARRAFVEEIGGSLITVAKDVKASIRFNPDYVEKYRLIGYENKLLTEEEFEDSSTDAGELGSGHTVTVVYEIVTKGTEQMADGDNFADVIIKYKPTENVGGDAEAETSLTLGIYKEDYTTEPSDNDLFVASVVEFALILRDSKYKADADLESLSARLALLDFANDPYRSEFRDLVNKYKAAKK